MRNVATGLGLTLAGVIAAGAMAVPALSAQEAAKEEYTPAQAETETLVQEPLHGAEGKQITVNRYTMPPGWVGGRHYHTGPVYVYILEGSFAVDEEGNDRQTFEAGQVYQEPIGHNMQAENLSASEPLKLLVIQVGDEGEPLMYKAE